MTGVILTRPTDAIAHSAQVYELAGFTVFQAPCFAIQTNPSVQAKWLQAPADVWVILSVHALKHASLLAPEWQPTENTHVIGVGPAVVTAWQGYFKHPIHSPASMNSEGVIEMLQEIKPQSIKILTTAEGREAIKAYCQQQGISYAQINTYLRQPLSIDAAELKQWVQGHDQVVLTATSVNILQHMVSQVGAEWGDQLKKIPLVVGSNRIQQTAQSLGFSDVHVANNPSDEAMCEAALCV